MQTFYIRFIAQYDDPVWGPQPSPWMYSQLVRVTRNRLRKASFEWVGNQREPFSLAEVRARYPLAIPATLRDAAAKLAKRRERKEKQA